MLRPPADAFFEVRLELGPLPKEDLVALVERRLSAARPPELTPEVVEELAADGHPRAALDAARRLVTGEVTWGELRRAASERERQVGRLGQPARMAVRALGDVGGAASASDQELLDRLGWTRARAVQVLGGLERAGVVVADNVRVGRAGRPRKVYRLPELASG